MTFSYWSREIKLIEAVLFLDRYNQQTAGLEFATLREVFMAR
jgi:hypothetical protein